MSTLFAVRHGQASFMSADYDRLSELGFTQGRALGHWWARHEIALDRVYVGPRRRHRETHEAAREAYTAAGGTWPEVVDAPGLDEYEFGALMQQGLTAVQGHSAELDRLIHDLMADADNRMRNFQRLFEEATRRWVRQELVFDGSEPFAAFRARVEASFDTMTTDVAGGANVAAFTSGGPVGVITASTLGLDDERALELSWMVRNGAFSEIRFSGARRSLAAFSATNHLDPPLWTYR